MSQKLDEKTVRLIAKFARIEAEERFPDRCSFEQAVEEIKVIMTLVTFLTAMDDAAPSRLKFVLNVGIIPLIFFRSCFSIIKKE